MEVLLKRSLFVLLVLFSAASQAAEKAPSSKGEVEVGAAFGFPIIAGAVIGYWGPASLPIVARLHAGLGIGGDLGFQLGAESPVKKYVVATGGEMINADLGTIGGAMGIRYEGFFAQAGPCAILSGSRTYFGAQGMIGFSAAF